MKNKNSSILKIVLWSAVALILINVMMIGIGFGSFTFGVNKYPNASKYTAGEGEIDSDSISEIEINWIEGNVSIEIYDGDTVRFYEESRRELDEKDMLHYYNENGRLIIQYEKPRTNIFSFGRYKYDKQLTVQVPEEMTNLKTLRLDLVSSDSDVTGINVKYLDIENISGNVSLKDIEVSELDIETVSGSIDSDNTIVKKYADVETTSGNAKLSGSVNRINFESISGDLDLLSDICPEEIDTDTISGDINITIPTNEGFTYSYDGLSGDINCEFDITKNDDEAVHGNGKSEFSFDSVSGDVNIIKKRAA